MKYKLLLLDVDGTTVASKGQAIPSERVSKAVIAAQKHVHVGLATGRPFDLAKPIIDKLGLSGPGVFNGGAEIINMDTGEILVSRKLDIPTVQELIKLALPFGYPIFIDQQQRGEAVKTIEDVTAPVAKLLIEAIKTDDAVHVLEQLTGVPLTEAHPTTSWQDGDVVDIHVTHELATKRHGAEQLIQLLGLTKEETIGVGDGHNDMPLLEATGLKVAMGNAPDEVKQLADYVAPSLAEDGVAAVIEKFIL